MSNSYVAINKLPIVKWQQDYVNSDSKQSTTLLYKDAHINSKVANQGYKLGPDQNRLQLQGRSQRGDMGACPPPSP